MVERKTHPCYEIYLMPMHIFYRSFLHACAVATRKCGLLALLSNCNSHAFEPVYFINLYQYSSVSSFVIVAPLTTDTLVCDDSMDLASLKAPRAESF